MLRSSRTLQSKTVRHRLFRRLSWAWTVSAGKRHSDQSLEAKFVRGLRLSNE